MATVDGSFVADSIVRSPDIPGSFSVSAVIKRTIGPMPAGFPTVTETGGVKTASTSHTLTLPSFSAGDLIIVQSFVQYGDNAQTWTFNGSTSAFTRLYTAGYGPGGSEDVKYRVMQAGDDTSIAISLTYSVQYPYSIFLIPAGAFSGVPEAAAAAHSYTANPDPPSLTPSWGSKSTLWLAFVAGAYAPSGYPTDYSALGSRAGNTAIASAQRNYAAASDNPSAWTIYQWYNGASTIAVQPAADGSIGFSANALVKASLLSSFVARAIVKANSGTKTFSVESWVSTTVEGSFPTDAWVKATIEGTFTAASRIGYVYTIESSFTADAWVQATIEGTFTADAWIPATVYSSFATDAIVKADSGTKTFSVESWISDVVVVGAFTADAWVKATIIRSFVAAANLFGTQEWRKWIPVDAVIMPVPSGSFAIDYRVYDPALPPSWTNNPPGVVPPVNGAVPIKVFIDGVDVTGHIEWATASFNAKVNGAVGDCRFDVLDRDHTLEFAFGQEIQLFIDGVVRWGGWVLRPGRSFAMSVQPEPITSPVIWRIEGVDYNAIFDKRVLHDLSNAERTWNYEPGSWDDAVILDIWKYFDMEGFTLYAERVAAAILDIPGVTARGKKGGLLASGGYTLRDVFTAIINNTAAIFYCSPTKVITYVDSDRVNSPYTLTDRPYPVGTPTPTTTVIVFTDTFTRTETGSLGAGYTHLPDYGSGTVSVNGSYGLVDAGYQKYEVVIVDVPVIYGPLTVQLDFWIQSVANIQASSYNPFYWFGFGHINWGISVPDPVTTSPMTAHIALAPTWDNLDIQVDQSSWYTVKATFDGTSSMAKVWKTGTAEPGAWQITDLYAIKRRPEMFIEMDALTGEKAAIDNLTISRPADLLYVDTFTRTVTRGLGGDWVWSNDDTKSNFATKANVYVDGSAGAMPSAPEAPLTGSNYESFRNPGIVKPDAGVMRFDFWVPPLVGQAQYYPAYGLVLDHATAPVWTYVEREATGWSVGPFLYDEDPAIPTPGTFDPDPSSWYTVETTWDAARNTEWRVWKQGEARPETPVLSGQLTVDYPLNEGIAWIDFYYNAIGTVAKMDNIYLWQTVP